MLIFQWLFKNIVLRSQKSYGLFYKLFLDRPDFYRPVPNLCIKKQKQIYKNPLNFYSKKFTVIVSKIGVLGQKKLEGGGGVERHPPACLVLKV